MRIISISTVYDLNPLQIGWNNLSDPKRKRGNLKYSIPPELALLLKNSTVFAKLELEVLRAFTSKYALALYEAVARRVRLKHVFTERFALDDSRELLGVESDKLTTFGNLNQYAIKPALMEVNALMMSSVIKKRGFQPKSRAFYQPSTVNPARDAYKHRPCHRVSAVHLKRSQSVVRLRSHARSQRCKRQAVMCERFYHKKGPVRHPENADHRREG